MKRVGHKADAMCAAITANDIKEVARLATDGVDPNPVLSVEGTPALHRVIADGRVEMAKAIIRCGTNLEKRDACGRTALQFACMYATVPGREHLPKLLIDSGARLDAEGLGVSLIELAIRMKDDHTLRVLLEAGIVPTRSEKLAIEKFHRQSRDVGDRGQATR